MRRAEGTAFEWLLRRPRWSMPVNLVTMVIASVCLAGAFFLIATTRNVAWSLLLVAPVVASGMLFGLVPGAATGFAVVIAAGLTEHALGIGLLRSGWDYLVTGLVVSLVGGSVGQISGLNFERGRLLEELRSMLDRLKWNEEETQMSEGRYRDIFEHSAVSLWEEDITELWNTIERLKRERIGDFRTYLDEHPDFVSAAIQMTRVVDVNAATLELYEARTKEELLGSLDKTVDLSDPILLESFKGTLLTVAEGRRYYRGESTAITLTGKPLSIAVSSYIRGDREGQWRMVVNVMDITDRKQAESRVVHLNRLYAVLSEINHAIARMRDRETLLGEICRIAIDEGLFRMAWVGEVDEETRCVVPVASAGFTGNYLETIKISVLDVPEGRGPAGLAVREGRAATFGDMWSEPRATPWRAAAVEHGYHSCASVPIRKGERVIGTFTVYSEEPWFFDEDQIGLIEEIGSDLSFALWAMDEEANRQQAEETLRKNEARLRSIMESAGDAVVIVDGQGRVALWNVAATSLFGYSPEEVVGVPFAEIIPPEIGKLFRPNQKDGGRSDEWTRRDGVPFAFSGKTKHGQQIEVEFTLARWEVDGEPYVTGIFRDVTGRMRSEEKIREQAQLLDISSEAILVRDRRDRIRYWNRGAVRLYGWTAEEALGREDSDLLGLPEEERKEATADVFERGQWSGELRTTAKNGERLTVQASWTLLRDREGNPNGVLVVCSDISEKKLSEAQRLRNQRLESLGRLAGAIAHDLNNILTPILGGVETLELSEVTEEDQQTLSLIRNSVMRGANLVRQILTFASAGHGQYRELDFGEVLAEVEVMLKGTFPARTQFHVDVAPGLWPINGDPTQVHQVVMNLCVNARDALRDGGSVRVSAENVLPGSSAKRMHIDALPIRYVHLRVEDTGVGMEPTVIENIFDPFFTTKRSGAGTGLGLATALSIVKSHGGFIDVHSEPGNGSRFEVYLPAAQEAGEGRRTEPSKPLREGDDRLILVVDDEQPVRTIVREILSSHGYRVVDAENGVEAVQIYERRKGEIAAVMVDAIMPEMNGIATVRAIREMDPKAHMMIVSGLISDDQTEAARQQGVMEFVSKPFTAQDLLRSLDRTLSTE